MPRGIPGSGNSKYGITIAANVKGQEKIKRLGNSMQGVQGSAKNLAMSFKKLAGPLVAIAGAAATFQAIRKSFDVLAEREADFATLANGLTRVSTDAPKAAKALRGLADDLGFATLFDEKAFQKGFALLTSFKNIGLDSYGRVAETAADLAQINQVDLKSSFLQLAKALSDPARGLTALSRSGVIFTEQQREMILELQNSGREMEAQAEILRIVEGSYKGAAKAAAEGLAGALDTLGQRFRDFQELLGTLLAPILTPLLEATEKLVINLSNGIRVLLLNIPTLIENLKIVLVITKVWASTLIGIAAGKFFVALLANFGKLVAITKTLLTLEKIKLGYMKAQAAITALLASPKNLAGIVAGVGVAATVYAGLDKFIKDTVDSIEDNFSKLGNNLDFQAELLKGLEGTKIDLTEIDNLLKSLGINAKGTGDSLDKTFGEHMTTKLKAFKDSIKTVEEGMADVVIKGIKGMEDALVDFVMTGKLSFKDLARSIIADMARIAIRAMIIKPIMSAFGFAKGGVIDSGQQIKAYAKGGVVTKPTLFPMANGMGLMSEKGPEAIMPLKRGKDGRLGVEAQGGGTTNNIVVNVDSSGTETSGDQEGKMLGQVIAAAVKNTIVQEQRPGGLLAA